MVEPMPAQLQKQKPLRFAEPACYRHLMEQLQLYHLHAYDVDADVQYDKPAGTALLLIRYGDGQVQRSAEFPAETLKQPNEGMTAFFQEIAKDCKKTLISDYYKMMKM